MILVVGGTGRLGGHVVRGLDALGERTRVLTRDAGHADHLLDTGVEVVVGDVRDPGTLAAAVNGADVVVSAMHGFIGPRGVSPETVDRAGNLALVDAARTTGADVVMMSVVGASPESPMELFRAKFAAEQHLRTAGVGWTVVRSTAFMETWREVITQTAHKSGHVLVFGRGDNPVNFVSVLDVAALVTRVVRDRSTRGRVIEIGGPADFTLNQLAAAVAPGTGPARHIPRPMLVLMATTIGRLRPELGRQARAALAMDRVDLGFDATATRGEFQDLPVTTLQQLLSDPV
jgi:uncharacterized protein YbjT (DUF2867 family)